MTWQPRHQQHDTTERERQARQVNVPAAWPFPRAAQVIRPRTLRDDGADVARLADEEPAPW